MLPASVILAVLGWTGNILLGRKIANGWIIALINQFILFGMGIATTGYGLCALSTVNAVIAVRNFRAWRSEAKPS